MLRAGAPIRHLQEMLGHALWGQLFGRTRRRSLRGRRIVVLPGQYFDSEAWLNYNYHRHYWPHMGLYVQPDPIGLAGGLNPYLYAGGNPLRFEDPQGLIKDSVDAAIEQAVVRGDLRQLKFLLKEVANLSETETDTLVRQCTANALKISEKIARQMAKRGWTRKAMEEAVRSGKTVRAINKATGNPATRYISPTTGQSVVVDDVTGEVVQVGGPGFQFGPNSGDLP